MAGAQQGVVATAGRAVQRWLRGVPVGCRHGEQVAAMTLLASARARRRCAGRSGTSTRVT
ncbi:hypothetical protein ACFQ0B_78875 [Nonomuraea thailandensis]